MGIAEIHLGDGHVVIAYPEGDEHEPASFTVLNLPLSFQNEQEADAVAVAKELGSVKVGDITDSFYRAVQNPTSTNPFPENRGGESTLGNQVAEVQRWATEKPESGGAQIAFMNPGGVRADFLVNNSPAGEAPAPITERGVREAPVREAPVAEGRALAFPASRNSFERALRDRSPEQVQSIAGRPTATQREQGVLVYVYREATLNPASGAPDAAALVLFIGERASVFRYIEETER